MLQQTVKSIAESLIGLEEKPGNSGFYGFPDAFRSLMEDTFGYPVYRSAEELFIAIGWKHGQAWCDYAGELTWRLGYHFYDTALAHKVGKMFTGSAVGTLGKFKRAKWSHSFTPTIGALAFWQKPNSWKGHEGIVTQILTPDLENFITVEGNTNVKGQREGKYMMERQNDTGTRGDLIFKGFIALKEV